jgi:hypothetical protein
LIAVRSGVCVVVIFSVLLSLVTLPLLFLGDLRRHMRRLLSHWRFIS